MHVVPSYQQSKISTKLSPIQVAETLKETHYLVFKKYPSSTRLAMAWAQIALENGRGDNIYNHNLGNIGSGQKQLHYKVARSRFRSFYSSQEGGVAYWNLLKERCPIALLSFNWGDINSTSEYLRRCGYYRAEIKHYQNGMRSLYYVALREVIPVMENKK